MYKYIFIVTTPRAGSTLAQTLLMNVEGVVSTHETHFFSNLNKRNFFSKDFFSTKSLFSDCFKALNTSSPDISRISLSWRTKLVESYKLAVDSFVVDKSGDIFLEKTPRHLHYIEDIKKYFDNPLFVHVERDSYDNVMSLYKASNDYPEGWGGARSVEDCIARWVFDKNIHDSYRGVEGHVFFDYKDIVNNPESYIKKLALMLNLDWQGRIDVGLAGEVVASSEPWKSNNFSNVGQVQNKKNILTRAEFDLILSRFF